MDPSDYKESSNSIIKRYLDIRGCLNLDSIKKEISELEKLTSDQGFWNNASKAKKVLQSISDMKNEIFVADNLQSKFDDLKICNEIIESDSMEDSYIDILNDFIKMVEDFELKNILNDKDDGKDAIVTIHPGAGGTESQDWAEMLYRMYVRWADKKKFKIKMLDYQPGDEAGIKDVSLEVSGICAYGYLKAERGVHRLVRISPFDSNGKRHTSFASVFVSPVADEDVPIEINDADLKIDTYRASGAGGQHVNKTDSAVRITHLPTRITVQCQNERSQLKNKNTAIKMLKSKLYQKYLEEKTEDLKEISETKKDIGWGSQIRSYVFHPYNLVKDHRTDTQTSNVGSVLDGEIDMFVKNYLINNMEKKSE
ncbi:MAG: peptide chain release factor 2 [Candidatus Marinimicrobia bacterium]|nr:peptide chain release factor 2 [Candidatus Neomarinimicrobiota bacterium]